MKDKLLLCEVSTSSLDAVLSLPEASKLSYFKALVENFYPKTDKDSEEYVSLLESYYSSFYLEKLYRTNNFFNEKFTVVYTSTGLIRNIISDMYYCDDDLVVH